MVWYGYSVSSPGEVTMCRPGLDEVGRQVVVAWGMQIGNCNFWSEQGAGEMMGDTISPTL